MLHLYKWINKPEQQTQYLGGRVWPREWGLCYWDFQIHITQGKKKTPAFRPLTGIANSSEQHLITAHLSPVFRMEKSQPSFPEMKYRHAQLYFSLALLLDWLPAPAVRSNDTLPPTSCLDGAAEKRSYAGTCATRRQAAVRRHKPQTRSRLSLICRFIIAKYNIYIMYSDIFKNFIQKQVSTKLNQ